MTHVPRSYTKARCDAALKGHTNVVQSLVECKTDINCALLSAVVGQCAMLNEGTEISRHTSVYAEWTAHLVEALIKYKADVDFNTNGVLDALSICCSFMICEEFEEKQANQLNILKVLLKNKADPNKAVSHQPSLIELCGSYRNRNEAVRLLLDDPNTTVSYSYKQPPLIELCQMGGSYQNEAVRLLLEYKANPNCVTHVNWDSSPATPFISAGIPAIWITVNQDDPEGLSKLLIRHKADLNARVPVGPRKGYTALHALVLNRDNVCTETIRMFLDAGANPHITVKGMGDSENVMGLMQFKSINLDEGVCKRLENLWSARNSIKDCERQFQAIKKDIPTFRNMRRRVQRQWDVRCLLDQYMKSSESPDDRRRLYFSEFCRREWARVLISPYHSVVGSTKRTPSSEVGIVQLRRFLQSLYKDRQRYFGSHIIKYCSAC